jgi:queuosine precursor transporter
MNDKLRVTNHDHEWHPKYYAVVVGLFCGLYMITLAITPKMVDIYGLILPAGIITFPLCCIITDLLTEVYGFNRTRKAIWTTLLCVVLFSLFTQLAIMMKPAGFWQNQAAFETVFGTSVRIAAAGCLAWVAGEFVNSYVMSKMKILQRAKAMSARFIGSTVVGQFVDTMVFFTVAFAGTMPWDSFLVMCATAWAFKVGYEIIALPLSVPIPTKVKHLEGIEHFDKQKISIV